MITVIFFALQLALGIATYLISGNLQEKSLLISGILAIVLYATVAIHEGIKERWIISPLVAYMGMSVLYVGIAPIWAYFAYTLGYDYLFDTGLVEVGSVMPVAHAFGIIGMTFFYLGYKVTQRGKINQLSSHLSKLPPPLHASVSTWVLIIGFAWAVRKADMFGISLGIFGTFFKHFAMFTSSGTFFLLCSNVDTSGPVLRIRPAGWRLYLAIGVALLDLFFHGLDSGMRNPILLLIIFLLWGYIMQQEADFRSRSPLKKVKTLLKPALLVAVFMIATLTIILPFGKQIARGEGLPTRHDVLSNPSEDFPSEGIWTLPSRAAADSLCGLGACIELRGYIPPENTVLDIVTFGVIPRLLWSNKPYVTQAANFTMVLNPLASGGESEKDATSATGMSAIGELYWSYGIMGIIVGMTLCGLLYGFTYAVFSRDFVIHPIRAIAVMSLVISNLMWLESDISSAYVNIIYIWVVFYPLSWIGIFWQSRRSRGFAKARSPYGLR